MPRSRSGPGPAPLLALASALIALVGGAAWWFLSAADGQPTGPEDVAVVDAPLDSGAPETPDIAPVERDRPDPEPAPEHDRPRLGEVVGRLVDRDRLPVRSGTLVALEGQLLGLGVSSGLPRLGPSAAVAEDGSFLMTEVPVSDSLVLQARGDSFAVTELGPFSLTDGQRLDVGPIEVNQGLGFSGRVKDQRGRGLAGAQVALYRSVRLAASHDPERVVLTEADGRYRIDHVGRGPFALIASAEGFASASFERGVSLDPSEHVEINLTLQPGYDLTGLVLAPAESGRSGEPGRPARDVEILARPGGHGRAPQTVRSGTDGRFVLPDLGAGDWTLSTDPEGALPLTVEVPDVAAAGELLLQLQQAGSLAGTVVSEDGETLTAFDLQLRRSTKQGLLGEVFGRSQRVRDREGRWLVEDLETGWYKPEVWARGHAVTLGPHVLVRKGERVDGVRLVMQPAAVLSGQVVDDLGQPVSGARVALHTNLTARSDFLRSGQDQASWYGSTTTDRDGQFALENVTAQTYQVSISHPDYPVEYRDDVLVPVGSEVELEPFVLDRPATLSGFVVDANGQPLRGASVHLGGGRNRASHQLLSDGEGHFRFERLARGSYRIQAIRHDAAPLQALSSSMDRLRQAAERHRAGEPLEQALSDLSLEPGQELTMTLRVDG